MSLAAAHRVTGRTPVIKNRRERFLTSLAAAHRVPVIKKPAGAGFSSFVVRDYRRDGVILA